MLQSTKTGDEFQPREVPCLFLGYPVTQKGYKLLNLLTDQIFISRDVIFHEHIFSFQQSSLTRYKYPILAFFPKYPPIHIDTACKDEEMIPSTVTEQAQEQLDSATTSPVGPAVETSISPQPVPPTQHLPALMRTSSRVSKKPGWPQDYVTVTTIRSLILDDLTYEHICPDYRAYLSATAHSAYLVLFTRAVQDEKWCAAMILELRALEDNNTWLIITLPPGKKAIGASEYIEVISIQTAELTNIKPGWWLKDIVSNLVWITMKLLPLWTSRKKFICLFLKDMLVMAVR